MATLLLHACSSSIIVEGGVITRERACSSNRSSRRSAKPVSPVVPRYMVRTARPRFVRVRRTYSSACPQGKLPCASGTYSTQEAGTRSPYVQYGGPGAYV
eukprot:scaffold85425_cov70-Phaeocystis_antarctica.AAC.2